MRHIIKVAVSVVVAAGISAPGVAQAYDGYFYAYDQPNFQGP